MMSRACIVVRTSLSFLRSLILSDILIHRKWGRSCGPTPEFIEKLTVREECRSLAVLVTRILLDRRNYWAIPRVSNKSAGI
jgi:hypothetical protein